jgi:hypothetical protein
MGGAGGGGGWGAAGGFGGFNLSVAGGAGGPAITLNNNTITWVGGSASYSRVYGTVLSPTISSSVPVASYSLDNNRAVTGFIDIPVVVAGGTSPYTYSITPSLPTGLSFNTSTGQITGTPTALSSSTSYTVTITELGGYQTSGSFTLAVLNQFTFSPTITSTQNLNIKNYALATGWNGTSILNATITIGAGVYIWTDSTSLYALDTGSSFPVGSTISIINNGFIMGKGGAGGSGSPYGVAPLYNGRVGGPAINIGLNGTSINTTNGYIGGGGGGGGAIFSYYEPGSFGDGGGGGAGGGQGGDGSTDTPGRDEAPGAAGGAIGQKGNNGYVNRYYGTGGAGGRIMPGATQYYFDVNIGAGGDAGGAGHWEGGYGGGAGNPGGPGRMGGGGGAGGGGGYGASGGIGGYASSPAITFAAQGTGAAGGKAINLNGNSITLTNPSSTVYGAVS